MSTGTRGAKATKVKVEPGRGGRGRGGTGGRSSGGERSGNQNPQSSPQQSPAAVPASPGAPQPKEIETGDLVQVMPLLHT